jgi:hypothetical protein
LPNKLQRKLRSIKDQGWQFSVTLDESWFCFITDYERIWLRPDQEPPEEPKRTIQDKKNMASIAWNPLGFHVLEALPKGRTFDADCYRDNSLTELVPRRPEGNGRKHIIHSEDARAHRAQKGIGSCPENGLRLAIHLP